MMNEEKVPDAMKGDVGKVLGILKRYGCREVYLCNTVDLSRQEKHREIELGIKGLDPELFFKVYGELCFELDSGVRLLDFGVHKRYYSFMSDEGECIRVG